MNATTARALIIGVLIALWAWLAGVARLQVSLWAGLVALGCFFAAGGGLLGLQKTLAATLSGVVWVLVADTVRIAIGAHGVAAALLLGAAAVGLMLQSRVPLLSFTAGAFAGAGVALAPPGVSTMYDAIRVGVSLAVGALLGVVAERLAAQIGSRRG